MWDWLNGKKTNFGLLALGFTEIGEAVAKFANETWVGTPEDYTKLFAYGVLVVGVLHRLIKGT